MKVNVRLLKKIKAHILAEPKRVNMNSWCWEKPKSQGGPACGTVGCIAGWAVLLSVPKKRWGHWTELGKLKWNHDVDEKAQELLRITSLQAADLFTPFGIYGSPHTKSYAKQVAARIDRFIENHK